MLIPAPFDRTTLEVHSDGASHARGGLPGGWACIIARKDERLPFPMVLTARWGSNGSTTNNVMELTGALEGLKLAVTLKKALEPVVLVSDSEYVLYIANGRNEPSANAELATRLRHLFIQLNATIRHVRGHQLKKRDDWRQAHPDVLLNYRCDHLAGRAKRSI